MAGYVFALSVHHDSLDEVRRQWEELALDTQAVLPEAAFALITPALGLSLLDSQYQCLDLENFPFSLCDRIASFFGFGIYALEISRFQLKGYKL